MLTFWIFNKCNALISSKVLKIKIIYLLIFKRLLVKTENNIYSNFLFLFNHQNTSHSPQISSFFSTITTPSPSCFFSEFFFFYFQKFFITSFCLLYVLDRFILTFYLKIISNLTLFNMLRFSYCVYGKFIT